MQAAQKKRLEEKNAKQIRELAALPTNRNCFECGQRGPTYVNITEGSFCCTGCSGILRGLNPPHRVKSISMASFTTDEVEKLRGLGNAENAKIWLGLYGGSPPAMTNRDAIQTFLVKKYEKKAWYVSKAELNEQERLMNQAKEAASRTDSHDSASVTSIPKSNDLDLFSVDPFAPTGSSSLPQPQSTTNDSFTQPQPFSPPAWLAPPPPFSFDTALSTTGPVNPTASVQSMLPTFTAPGLPSNPPLFAPPSLPSSARSKTAAQMDIFADFETKFNDLSFHTSNTVSTFKTNAPVPPSSVFPKSATIDSGIASLLQPTPVTLNPFQLPAAPLVPASLLNSTASAVPSIVNSTISVPCVGETVPPSVNASYGDKYSALAELDELFHHSGSSQGEIKAAWMPSGFSTGIPPSATTHSVQQLHINGGNKQAINGFGSFPKSNTMGSIADYGVNNPFLATQNSPYPQAAFPNPFSTAAPMSMPPQQQGPLPTSNQNALPQPSIPPRPTVSASNSNWNPFL